MLIQDALERFVTQLEADGRSHHTIGQYRRHVRALAAWVGPRSTLADLSHEVVARFLAASAARTRPDGGVKRATSVNALRTSLRQFLAFAHAAGWTPENHARFVRPALCGRPLPKALPDEDVTRLLGAITDPRDHALVHLLLGTGIRLGSALALDASDLDFDRGEVLLRRTKGDRVERAVMPRAVAEVLRGYVAGRAGRVFPITARHAHRRLAHWLAVAGITHPASPHALRHTFATRLLTKTGDISLVQRALRHRSITATMVYAEVDDRRVREAVEA